MADNFDDVLRQMSAAGVTPPEHLQVGLGRITRYGKKKNSWYIVHEHQLRNGKTVLVGAFGDWAQQISQKIEVEWRGFDAAEREALQAQIRAREAREAERRERKAAMAQNRARGQWKSALTISQAAERGIVSPYLERKGVTPEGVRFFEDGTILIPAYVPAEISGSTLVGLQKIAPDGDKKFNAGMAKQGASMMLGKRPADGEPIYVVEGYATGRSVRMAALAWPCAVFCAFDCGNLVPVARTLRRLYPKSPLIFCADDDWQTPGNPGVAKARDAAMEAGYAWVVVPLFETATREPKWTDFNDLHAAVGLENVFSQVDANLVLAEPPFAPAHFEEREDAREPSQGSAQFTTPETTTGSGSSGEPPNDPPNPPETPVRPDGDDGDRHWSYWLKRTDKHVVKPVLFNLVHILRNHEDCRGMLAFDQYAELIMKVKPPPWHGDHPFKVGEWSEVDDYKFRLWLSDRFCEAKEKDVMQAVTLVAREHTWHPLIEWLEGVKWDGTHRLKTWLIDYLGCCKGRDFEKLELAERDKTAAYVEAVGAKWMIGAVGRVFTAARNGAVTGSQMDTMLILEGEQGLMKSTALRVLGDEWFTDEKLDFGNKDSFLILQGRWIIEMAELEGLNKADTSATKHFITKREDLFRAPYGRKLEKKPRRCAFAGTVNPVQGYLKDDSGNRRFWPVACTVIDLDGLRANVRQLWAEAVHRFKAGERWWVEPHERELFVVEQEKRFQEDAWRDAIEDYLVGKKMVTVSEVMEHALKIDRARWDMLATRRVGSILHRLEWMRRQRNISGRVQWVYLAPSAEDGGPLRKPGDDDAAF